MARTMPAGSARDRRPPAGCLRRTDPGRDVTLVYADKELLGACKGTSIPEPQFCP
jgi:hypothetical protein